MPTELEELVGFLAHGNRQIRNVALENLVPFSLSEPSIFKSNNCVPVHSLKLLVRDSDPKIAGDAETILVNISGDADVLQHLATDEKLLRYVLTHIGNPGNPNADLLSMLLANMAKWNDFKRIVDLRQDLGGSDGPVMNHLVDLFVKGADGGYNKDANFDYLAYLFADLAKHAEARRYFVTRQAYDDAIPLTKLKVFTEHASDVRRKGVASTIKNVAFDVPSHRAFLSEQDINILPYILLPITGNEEYDEEETMSMLPDLQLLPPDKRRDPDSNIIQTHVETLTLLTSTREGRDLMRDIKIYPIIRETHARVDDDGVREACERLVQVLMRDEENAVDDVAILEEVEDEDEQIVEV